MPFWVRCLTSDLHRFWSLLQDLCSFVHDGMAPFVMEADVFVMTTNPASMMAWLHCDGDKRFGCKNQPMKTTAASMMARLHL
eukprot:1145625-Pelagomonas_calceolata.AAC.8